MKTSSPANKQAGAKKRASAGAAKKKQPAGGLKKKAAPKTAKVAGKAVKKTARKAAAKKKKPHAWMLRLYVAGQTPKSLTAFSNLKRLCEQHMTADQYEIEVIDLIQQPHLAMSDQIVALPTLVRRLPAPIKRVVGDLSNTDRVLVGMDLVTALQ